MLPVNSPFLLPALWEKPLPLEKVQCHLLTLQSTWSAALLLHPLHGEGSSEGRSFTWDVEHCRVPQTSPQNPLLSTSQQSSGHQQDPGGEEAPPCR